jgi:hypothetical protein
MLLTSVTMASSMSLGGNLTDMLIIEGRPVTFAWDMTQSTAAMLIGIDW